MIGNVCTLLLFFLFLTFLQWIVFHLFLPPLPKKKTKGNVLPKFPNNELIIHTNPIINIPQNAAPNENYIVFVVLSSNQQNFK